MLGNNPLFDLTGRTALITGSSQGLGLAMARGLAQAGAAVVLNGRDERKLAGAAEGLRAEGAKVATAAFDVTDGAAAAAAVARVEADVAPLDILVNNAGIHRRAPLIEMTEEQWRAKLKDLEDKHKRKGDEMKKASQREQETMRHGFEQEKVPSPPCPSRAPPPPPIHLTLPLSLSIPRATLLPLIPAILIVSV